MNIDLSELNNKKHGKRELDLVISKDSFYDNGEVIKFTKPIKFTGIVRLIDNIYELTGNVETEVLLPCSRCSEDFFYHVNMDISEKLSDTIKDEDGEIISINNDKIDIYQIIENNLSMELPVKKICKEDCKGLCQHCGTNLNHNSCDCEKDDIDPRLAKLKELFSKP
ncbi:MAG: DUF177 domain-containing protein [Clostridium argentinense]|uniref:DUF177 domain-containing protein n=2 Tax=Clostridiaceae TaxID=31979 RepID=A0ABR8YXZ7_9CLOT|nr:DUF177 domain-containing protein [Clostridium faecium]MBS5822771.1 DUF177 domain-containing protein [Clostridium argentinense]MDU1348127.1 DUF177 domain-containing protein [Clostridium argentinense]